MCMLFRAFMIFMIGGIFMTKKKKAALALMCVLTLSTLCGNFS